MTEIARNVCAIRAPHFMISVIDTQGLLKTGMLSRASRAARGMATTRPVFVNRWPRLL